MYRFPLPLFKVGDQVKSRTYPELGLLEVTYVEPYIEAFSIGAVPIVTVMIPYTGQEDDDADDLRLINRPTNVVYQYYKEGA